ncbi:hypothetical protein PVAG01_11099 [Phlyctema vagabunda]|uniref:Chromo domain-containing protein n=1 Tax=Phlyctema vagabunda TaxID=108571 RepID=A0ABR4P1B8_9HELO
MPHAADTKQEQQSLLDVITKTPSSKRPRDKNHDLQPLPRKKARTAKDTSISRAKEEPAQHEPRSTTAKQRRLRKSPRTLSQPLTEDDSDDCEENTVELLVHGRQRRSTAGKTSTARPLHDPLDAIFDEDEDDSDFEDNDEDSDAEDMNMDVETGEGIVKSVGRKTKAGRAPAVRTSTPVKKLESVEERVEHILERAGTPPASSKSATEYLVDTIGHEEVLVRWLGFPKAKDNTWEDVETFREGCGPEVLQILQEYLPRARLHYYHAVNGERPGSTARSSRRSMP